MSQTKEKETGALVLPIPSGDLAKDLDVIKRNLSNPALSNESALNYLIDALLHDLPRGS